MNNNKFLVTSAFPYSNGPIHLGHILENIQADIWVRYKKMNKENIYFICSDDSHGTPIMLKSKKLKINTLYYIKKMYFNHKNNFKKFSIDHDNYYLTHSSENKRVISNIFNILKNKNLIIEKKINQLFDDNNKIFLPDRFIIGSCPKCLTKNQYGDLCEYCGYKYNCIDLINPKSIISNSNLIIKETNHLFFNLPVFKNNLIFWINSINLQKSVLNKIHNCIDLGLNMWDISRDYPYFGFKIPNYNNKFFYVWIDALVGYISTFNNLYKFNNNIIENYWSINSNSKIYQFIGKDIIYFHLLLWPSILEGINFKKPDKIIVHGHLKINGNKMSKSNNNFISVEKYLEYLDSDLLRYYFSSKLSNNIEDINFDITNFVNKINSDIINKILNLASRNFKILETNFNSVLSNKIDDNIYNYFISKSNIIFNLYEKFEFNKIINNIIKLSNLANKYISDNKPWDFIINKKKKSHIICSTGLNLFKIIITYLKPIIPKISSYSEELLGIKLNLYNLDKPIKSFHRINKFILKFKKININYVNKIFN
ncbi:methionine--tRNA ligase [endosymbiont of Pachyrhynchus infernalis]|uniref:methionine--tRNA ligase n=1 Tax=endosymbiont of Pachyrhynchus infernalis TaxID=1971488 RepID=UPI000DC73F8C|nr:methionine--tRNA ligase [endosymbiont of Pachyrhynchus infernalis]BBA84779.1 methionine--tRNA ligase [endosymbiont of Pachyrhynchus infernalis]